MLLARIHPMPAPVPSGSELCCATMLDPWLAYMCALSLGILGIWYVRSATGHALPGWSTSYPHVKQYCRFWNLLILLTWVSYVFPVPPRLSWWRPPWPPWLTMGWFWYGGDGCWYVILWWWLNWTGWRPPCWDTVWTLFLVVVPVAETFIFLSIGVGPGAGNWWWVGSQILPGMACSTHSQVHSMLSEGGVGGFLFPIYLGGPIMRAPFLMLLLRSLHRK